MTHWISKQSTSPDGMLVFLPVGGEVFEDFEQATSRALALSRRHPRQVFIVNDGTGAPILSALDGEDRPAPASTSTAVVHRLGQVYGPS
ncbi:hypothetical protein LVJ94_25765 [Pendulispora rubella]|uniref:Uncharacterized protein n=1 Tax=Pendulispora rubella TaxID=2741070 RepID=A0ABZ2LLH1_9BACT